MIVYTLCVWDTQLKSCFDYFKIITYENIILTEVCNLTCTTIINIYV